MRTRMYGGVGGRKTKVGRKLTFVFLLPDYMYLLKRPSSIRIKGSLAEEGAYY